MFGRVVANQVSVKFWTTHPTHPPHHQNVWPVGIEPTLTLTVVTTSVNWKTSTSPQFTRTNHTRTERTRNSESHSRFTNKDEIWQTWDLWWEEQSNDQNVLGQATGKSHKKATHCKRSDLVKQDDDTYTSWRRFELCSISRSHWKFVVKVRWESQSATSWKLAEVFQCLMRAPQHAEVTNCQIFWMFCGFVSNLHVRYGTFAPIFFFFFFCRAEIYFIL